MLRRYIGTFHVNTPDAEIEEDIRTRAVENGGEEYNGEYTDRMVMQALTYHHENQELYRKVMEGRLG